jgi:hypothetical protein
VTEEAKISQLRHWSLGRSGGKSWEAAQDNAMLREKSALRLKIEECICGGVLFGLPRCQLDVTCNCIWTSLGLIYL